MDVKPGDDVSMVRLSSGKVIIVGPMHVEDAVYDPGRAAYISKVTFCLQIAEIGRLRQEQEEFRQCPECGYIGKVGLHDAEGRTE